MHDSSRFGIGLIAAALACTGGVHPAYGQEYPSKPIRMVVQSPPGGGADLFARLVGKQLSESWGQTVIVDNRPGAGGVLGTEIAARAAPDGYTLLLVPSSHAINPSFYRKLPYDPVKDFAAVGLIATSPNIVVVHPSLPVRTVAQLIALAKKRPGELAYGSAGVGQTSHLSGELFSSLAKIKVVHVPYKGSGPAEIDLAGGHLQYMVDSMPAGLPNVRSGRTVALATTGKNRTPILPEAPTVAESGLPGYEFTTWWGIAAPAGTPQSVIAKLNAEIARIIARPDIKELMLTQGAEAHASSPQEFMDHIKAQIDFFARIVANAGIKPE